MKYLNIKIKVNIKDKMSFHKIIETFHNITIPYHHYIKKYDFGYMIEDEHIIAYHIEDKAIYNYIYNEEELCVYIGVDSYSREYKNLFRYIVDNGYYDGEELFRCPLSKDDYRLFKNSDRPIVYLSHQYAKESFIHDLKGCLGELGYVVYGDDEFEELLFNDIKIKGNCIIYPNNDIHKISRSSKESIDSFIERISYKIISYSSKRVYEYPYRMNELYQKSLYKMLKDNHSDLLTQELGYLIGDLESQINDYEKKIDDLNKEIFLKTYRIKDLEERLESKGKKPLLFKGDIKEHYYMEQKDIVLHIIKEELKSETDEHLLEIYKQILQDNPFEKVRSKVPSKCCDMNRAELLMNIEEALNMTSIDRVMDCLEKNCGFDVDKNGHNGTYFFNDDQCPVTFASSPSDANFGWQMLRRVKKVCF